MSERDFVYALQQTRELACSDASYAPSTSTVNGMNWANGEIGRLRIEVERLTAENDKLRHFNKLYPAELERLALLIEEMGEANQIIGKVLRHGYESKNPVEPGPTDR